ncbi:MAG: hypothetical protein AAFO96_03580 [Bacteroidota bacterium]
MTNIDENAAEAYLAFIHASNLRNVFKGLLEEQGFSSLSLSVIEYLAITDNLNQLNTTAKVGQYANALGVESKVMNLELEILQIQGFIEKNQDEEEGEFFMLTEEGLQLGSLLLSPLDFMLVQSSLPDETWEVLKTVSEELSEQYANRCISFIDDRIDA